MLYSIVFKAILCYDFPASYPSIDQTVMISGALLQDPVILAAVAKVNAAVKDKSLLNLKPSTYKPSTPSKPQYNENPALTCYWPFRQCTKSSNPTIVADITTCPGQNNWALTFDDGPSKNIVRGANVDDSTTLRRLLDAYQVKATFFIVGSYAIQFPDVVKAHYDAGHQIALHTWSHHPLTALTNEQIVAEIKYNEAIVFKAIGAIPTMFRPPYGDIDDRVRAIIQALGYKIVFWTRDSTDSWQPDTSSGSQGIVVNTIASWFRPSSSFIGLQHDLSTFSVGAATIALKYFFSMKRRPLNIMSVAKCLNEPRYVPTSGNYDQLTKAIVDLSMLLLIHTFAYAYKFPKSYPNTGQQIMIDEAYLKDPFIIEAMEKVKNIVKDSKLLALKPSTYNILTPNSPTYNENEIINCYWPKTRCSASSNQAILPDITTCPGQNTWGLTFDDGPSQNLLDGLHVDDSTALRTLLDSRNVKATFFVLGSSTMRYPNVVKAHFESGHQIALHTWSHHPLTSLTNEQIVGEIKYNEAIVVNATGVVPTMLRPPYGDVDDRVRAIAQALGYQIVLWNRDAKDLDQSDTSSASFENILNNYTSWYRQGEQSFISLEHDISTFSINAAIQALNQFFDLNPIPLTPMPVGTCVNASFYNTIRDPTSAPSGEAALNAWIATLAALLLLLYFEKELLALKI